MGPDGSIYFGFPDCIYNLGPPGTSFVSKHGNLYAINQDGTEKWTFQISANSTPSIGADGTIYVGSDDGKLYAVNQDGTQKWTFQTGSRISSSPAIGPDGTIDVSSCDNHLYAINSDGTRKWAFETGGHIKSSPAIGSDGSIYEHVGTVDFIDRGVDATTGSILVQANFPNPKLILRPGMYAKVKLAARNVEGAILIPQRCVMELQGLHSVYVVNDSNIVSSRQITTGPDVGDYKLVENGLKAV